MNKKQVAASKVWSDYYDSIKSNRNFYPENFVARVFSSKQPVRFIEDEYSDKEILDLGCGNGRHIPYLKSLGFKIHGLETSEQQIRKLKESFPDTDFTLGVSSSIPLKDNFFDYILACNSIYYVDDPKYGFKKNMQECSRVLKNKGLILFSMLGEKHSIFEDSYQVENNLFIIKKDFLKFRNEILVRPYLSNDNSEELFLNYEIKHHGEIIEKVSGTCRHIHYFLGINKS